MSFSALHVKKNPNETKLIVVYDLSLFLVRIRGFKGLGSLESL